jgi:predicted nucleic-acid-binding Zn-ribbon protein
MEKKQYVCDKCGNMSYEEGQFQATGGDLSKLFNVQNKKFTTISCTNCGFTEIYKTNTSRGMNILDFLMNS